MRTAEEIKAEIDKVEDERQYLAMKDMWSSSDREHDRELYRRLAALRNELAEVEG